MPPVIGSLQDFEAALAASSRCREAFWRQVGNLEADRISHLTSPIFFGEPDWPTTS